MEDNILNTHLTEDLYTENRKNSCNGIRKQTTQSLKYQTTGTYISQGRHMND